MTRRKKNPIEESDPEKYINEVYSKGYYSGYAGALHQCVFKLGLKKLGNPHGFLSFYRLACEKDITLLSERFELLLTATSWAEVFEPRKRRKRAK